MNFSPTDQADSGLGVAQRPEVDLGFSQRSSDCNLESWYCRPDPEVLLEKLFWGSSLLQPELGR